jgi:hypothetical protein
MSKRKIREMFAKRSLLKNRNKVHSWLLVLSNNKSIVESRHDISILFKCNLLEFAQSCYLMLTFNAILIILTSFNRLRIFEDGKSCVWYAIRKRQSYLFLLVALCIIIAIVAIWRSWMSFIMFAEEVQSIKADSRQIERSLDFQNKWHQ